MAHGIEVLSAQENHDVPFDPVRTPADKPCAANPKSAIVGDTLYIDGEIDGMTYDLLSWGNCWPEHQARRAELIRRRRGPGRGLGRNHPVARHDHECSDEKGEVLREHLYLVNGGRDITRTAHPTAKFGVHGVRIGGMVYIRKFYEACGDDGSQEKCNAFTALRQGSRRSLAASQARCSA